MASDFGGDACHTRRPAHLLSAAEPSRGSQVSDRRGEGVDLRTIATRRKTKIGAPQLLSVPGPGKRPRVASGLDLFWDDDRCLCADRLGAAASEIAGELLFE